MLSITLFFLIYASKLSPYATAEATGFFGSDCVEPCMNEMQMVMDSTPLGNADHPGQLSWSQLLQASKNRQLTESSFHGICSAYKKVDRCLQDCESKSEFGTQIRQTYAGLRFICVDHRQEFFNSLPCLAQYEPLAMSQCKAEINQSLAGSNLFSEAVINREHHNIRSRFRSLCQDLVQMIKCIEPVTRNSCGEEAARIMLKFITVGFTSFEKLYSQLGISDQLPISCRQLVSLTVPRSSSRRHNSNILRHPTGYELYTSNAFLSSSLTNTMIVFVHYLCLIYSFR
ncbi:hypothetical protein AB6A40_001869 [Gnathostoma spinigerum]|uniref:Chondroitin proteoglycan 4 domain-containing protein n=1 Tax=Gnathostoma spinigerum TaxID=75299 RepID=A0ABD6E673_9BILA